ncbi:MAG: M28 family peptidase, partial [Chitinophagaceae bacterium]
MKNFIILLLLAGTATAQSPKKADLDMIERLQEHVAYLADDRLEGRRTGTPGEQLAAEYISKKFNAAGLARRGDNNTYLQAFEASSKEKRTGHNVVGFIDNKASSTIILGAHYDHLGYGEDKNSLYADTIRSVHNGADDNASGTAALLELGKWLKKSKLKKYNYLLVAFSGEELGLFGSKHFADNLPVPASSINYMINMDMVGRLNDSTRSISIGGFGTSPHWSKLIKTDKSHFKIKIDSSGSGPSDHTSFYRKDIPVLFFFTGTHSDYHKPSDDKEKINYKGIGEIVNYIKNILKVTNEMEKMPFTKTREVSMSTSSFKVTLGVMLDYTFAGPGIFVEGVTSGRPGEKAGLKAGDIITAVGEYSLKDVTDYMKALGKFEKGQATTLKLKR